MNAGEYVILYANNQKPEYISGILNFYNDFGLDTSSRQKVREMITYFGAEPILYIIRTKCSGDRFELENIFRSLCTELSIFGI